MRKIFTLVLATTLLVSCSVQEKMLVKENMEATYSIGFDMSPMMKIESKDKPQKKEKAEYKKMDSTFTFKEIIAKMPKDSLAKMKPEDKARLEYLKDFTMHFKMDEEKKEFFYDLSFTVPNVNELKSAPSSKELGDFLIKNDKSMGNLSTFGDKKSDEDPKNQIKYAYDGNTFSKTTFNAEIKKINPKKKTKPKPKKSKKDEFSAFTDKMDEMIKECKYNLEYHFPKKIKSVSIVGAIISEDKKSFTYQIPFEDFDEFKDPDFNVVFE
jgi:uncharacterized FlaG/YvyC family protein